MAYTLADQLSDDMTELIAGFCRWLPVHGPSAPFTNILCFLSLTKLEFGVVLRSIASTAELVTW